MRSMNASRWWRSNCSHVVKVGGVAHAIQEQHAVEVVDLVLERARGQAAAQLVVRAAVAVEEADADA